MDEKLLSSGFNFRKSLMGLANNLYSKKKRKFENYSHYIIKRNQMLLVIPTKLYIILYFYKNDIITIRNNKMLLEQTTNQYIVRAVLK